MFKRFAPALATIVIASSQAHAAAPDAIAQAAGLLTQAKQATGGAAWDKIDTLVEHGTLAGPSVRGSYDSVTDLRHILSVENAALGPTVSGQGWDGHAAWSTDSTGQVRVERSQEATAAGIEQAYRAAYGFFWPDRWPASRSYVGEKQADGLTYDVVKVTPKDAQPLELWFDRATHRIAREADITGADPHTQILGDYRAVGGMMLPFSSRDTMGVAKYDIVATTGQFTLRGALPARRFGPPPPREPDPFPAGADQVSFPMSLHNNHIYVDVAIDGHPAAPFIFDTGAIAIIEATHAAALGIKPEGALPGGGFGEGTAAIGMARVRSVDLGGFKLTNQVFYSIDVSAGFKFDGADADGFLGYEIPKRAIMTIDYARKTVTLTRPGAFRPARDAVRIPFTFNEHVPMIKASIDGIPGEFEIDTGNAGGLDLFGPFVEAHHLVQRYHPTHSAVTGFGVGGATTSLLARASELRIGSISIAKPVALIESGSRGAAAAARTAGNIGGALLLRFTVTLDYGHQVLYLQPNAEANTPDVFDRAGLRLERDKDRATVVAAVTTGSGAEAAGVKSGDRILNIDGTDSPSLTLDDVRARLKAAPGTKVTLTLGRQGAAPKDVVVTLNDLV